MTIYEKQLQELNRKLAEGVGLCWHNFISAGNDPIAIKTPSKRGYNGYYFNCPKCGASSNALYLEDVESEYNFTQSFDTCLRELAPRLEFWMIDNEPNSETGVPFHAVAQRDGVRKQCWAETPALAFCLVVGKLIDEKVKDGRN